MDDVHEFNPDVTSSMIVEELFQSITNEIVDEINLPASSLQTPQFLGVTRNVSTYGKPSCGFLGTQLQFEIQHIYVACHELLADINQIKHDTQQSTVI